jgi:hypothetical protein
MTTLFLLCYLAFVGYMGYLAYKFSTFSTVPEDTTDAGIVQRVGRKRRTVSLEKRIGIVHVVSEVPVLSLGLINLTMRYKAFPTLALPTWWGLFPNNP